MQWISTPQIPGSSPGERAKQGSKNMGYYIELKSAFNKAQQIVEQLGGLIVDKPDSFDQIPEGEALICVVNNSFFEAAAFIYS